MKKLNISCILAMTTIMLSSCSAPDLSEKAKQEIIDADKTMSDIAAKDGFFKTLLAFADDSVVKPEENNFPVIGKMELINHWSSKKETTAIEWKPFRAEASRSGELGYSLGSWRFATPDTVLYGFYYTIWKKQKDGKWKFVVDGGNNTPAISNW